MALPSRGGELQDVGMPEIGELLPQKIGAIKQKNVELADFTVRGQSVPFVRRRGG
jgi:hypothetical protein